MIRLVPFLRAFLLTICSLVYLNSTATFAAVNWEHIGHANDVVAMAAIKGKLFAATKDNKLWWRDPVGQDIDWEHIGHANDVVAMAAINGKLFAATKDNKLWWRDPVGQDIDWEHIGHANDVVAMAAINGKLFAATKDNKLWWRDPVGHEIDWKYIGHANDVVSMAAINGKLFAATKDNKLWWRDPVAEDVSAVEDRGESHKELTGGTPSAVPSWIVQIIDASSSCSASVLSEHYLLTAAHCAGKTVDLGYKDLTVMRATSAGTRASVYTGRVQFLIHPDYDHAALLDPENDIALVRLRSGAINLSLTGQARIYIDYVSPIWTKSEPQSFTFAGWGLTDLSSNSMCASGTSGILRIGNATGLRPASRDQKDMVAPEGKTHVCPGDSGSPWLFSRAGNYLAFAVTSGHWIELFTGTVDKATSIFPKWGWIYEASREPAGCDNVNCYDKFLDCKLGGALDDLPFHQCIERTRVSGPAPNPRTACPSGQHCCKPSTDKCNKCIPNNVLCQ
jgi:hypothetical protein